VTSASSDSSPIDVRCRATAFDFGTYTFDDGVLTYSTDPESMNCEGGQTGVHELEFTSDDEFSLTSVSEMCPARVRDATAPFKRNVP
jgi:hypothetical protein